MRLEAEQLSNRPAPTYPPGTWQHSADKLSRDIDAVEERVERQLDELTLHRWVLVALTLLALGLVVYLGARPAKAELPPFAAVLEFQRGD